MVEDRSEHPIEQSESISREEIPPLTDRQIFVLTERGRGRTQFDIGQELGLHRTTVGRIERGARMIKLMDRLVDVSRRLVEEYKNTPSSQD